MNIARFTADLGGLKPPSELTDRIRQAGRDLESFGRGLPDRLPRNLPQELSRRIPTAALARALPRRAPRLGPVAMVAIAAGGILAAVAVGAGVRTLLKRRAADKATATPGPALTTPDEIGIAAPVGGPMPDAITPGSDGLGASSGFAGHDDAGLEDMQGVANTLARH